MRQWNIDIIQWNRPSGPVPEWNTCILEHRQVEHTHSGTQTYWDID